MSKLSKLALVLSAITVSAAATAGIVSKHKATGGVGEPLGKAYLLHLLAQDFCSLLHHRLSRPLVLFTGMVFCKNSKILQS